MLKLIILIDRNYGLTFRYVDYRLNIIIDYATRAQCHIEKPTESWP